MKKKFFANLWLTFHSWSPFLHGIFLTGLPLFCRVLSPSLYNNKTASTITSARNSTAFKIIGIAASNVAGALLVR